VEEIMQVLMSHVSSPAGRDAAERLRASGHTVHTCYTPGSTGFACVALRGDDCPLESHPIDVALAVRSHPSSTPLLREDGIRCAVRRHVPLVVAGAVAPNPFSPWTTVERDGPDVVTAVEDAAELPLADLSERATHALREALGFAGVPAAGARATVRRRDGRLRVTLSVTDGIERGTLDVAAVRVHQALRAVDHWTDGIDVSFA
jgi:hypothetical protein